MDAKDNFNAWSPEAQGAVYRTDAADGEDMKQILLNKARAVDIFYSAVHKQMNDGVPIATGAGQTLPIPVLKNQTIENILFRIPSPYQLYENAGYERVLNDELEEVSIEYQHGSARASLEYTLRDQHEAKLLRPDSSLLSNKSKFDFWTDTTYQSNEWRVYRNTGVKASTVLSSFRRMSKTFSRTQLMLELQMQWEDDSLPSFWWDSNGHLQSCTYSKLLFTEANQSSFMKKLPITLEEFTTGVATHAKDIRESLSEHWLVSVGSNLNTYVSQLTDGGAIAKDKSKGTNGYDEMGSTKRGDQEKSSPLRSRLGIEGLNRSEAQQNGTLNQTQTDPQKERTKTERILDCAAVLMSRQLRGMCENSLLSISKLFSKMANPLCAEYSVFQVSLKIRKIGKKDPTTDFSDPVEIFLHPDISDFKAALTGSLRQIVNYSRDFSRAETIIGQVLQEMVST